ncbi:MAG TPA: hypothetical protein VIX82_12555 [Solirubrobacteraceae bacterium]
MRRSIAVVVTICGCLAIASVANARVLLVGTYHGIHGQFKSIQAAVNAAHPGDWILIGPGDYKTKGSHAPKGAATRPAAVLITKPGIYLRGMNRNTVIIDGTKAGPACNRRLADQNFGPTSAGGALGLNGIMVWKANNVWVQNLTVCNFLGGKGAAGNGIWWNGGDGSGKIGGRGYLGSYLTATSTFFATEKTAATYGIFTSNWSGGTWDQTYASNFNDSGYYIGACAQKCNQTINHAHAQFNALGYSGSNSGGRLLIENSQFDHNQDGLDTNSQNGDEPSPQNGACPPGVKPPVKGAPSCWVFINNSVHDNNLGNVPSAGSASQGPIGTGMSVAGGRNDTIMHNTFTNNGAWGIALVPYPSSGQPCIGGVPNFPLLGNGSCLFDGWGNALIGNTFVNDGFFGNPSNGDFAELNLLSGNATDCYSGNHGPNNGPLTADAAALQQLHPRCDESPAPAASNPSSFLVQIQCDTGVNATGGACPAGTNYPKLSTPIMRPFPKHLLTMANPCVGVPSNLWCRNSGHH